jgi:hypothetical protein
MMHRKAALGVAAAVAVSAIAFGASAQRGGDVSGEWRAQHTGSSGSVQTCDVTLTSQDWFGAWKASSFGCSGDLFGVDRYRIEGDEIVLIQGMSSVKARLRMRGGQLVGTDTRGRSVSLARKGSGPVVPPGRPGGGGDRPGGGGWDNGGWNGGGGGDCVRHGDSDRCATRAEMAPPQVRVITPANLRSQASLNSSVVTTIRKGTCVAVQECRQQGSEFWCKVQTDGYSGYLIQIARSQSSNQRVLVFKNGCAE